VEPEGKFSIIYTAKSRYVLDYADPDLSVPFSLRRVSLLKENLPYLLYPIKGKIDSLTDLITSTKHRVFIDATGTIKVWKPNKFHTITCHPILYREITDQGRMLIKAQGFEQLFNTELTNLQYVQVVKFRGVSVVWGFSDKAEKPKRKKL
jgi:hypothetical protein